MWAWAPTPVSRRKAAEIQREREVVFMSSTLFVMPSACQETCGPPLLRQQFLDLLLEVATASFGGANKAFLVHKPRGGNGVDSIAGADFVRPTLAVEVLRPRHAGCLRVFQQLPLV